jgi:hypothetical protein
MRARCLLAIVPVLTSSLLAQGAPPAGQRARPRVEGPRPDKGAKKATKKGASAWVAASPETMADQAAARARRGGHGALAALATLHSLADRAPTGHVKRRLETLGEGKGEIAEQARWLAASLDPQPQRAAPPGLVSSLAVLGPFQDTSGRIKERDIAEAEAKTWADRGATYSWGVYEVRWRPVLTPVTARGVPLSLYVQPRRETCSYVASRVTLPKEGPVVVHLAAAGAARLLWDGQDLAVSEEVHESALFDRIGARVEATAGDHLVAAKICSGALDDSSRVRIRIATPDGEPVAFQSSRDLAPLAGQTFAPIHATPHVEALARGLDPGKKPSAEAQLEAAALRRLAGVDDLRSPRAPGILDTLTKDPKISPDALAMAGWVSAFGASRSGWLGLARDRAADAGDADTADFAARRLAAARLDAGFADWALAALAGSIDKDEDAEAALLGARIRAEVGGEGAKRAAFALLQGYVDRHRERASVALLDELARLAAGFDPQAELRARDELARVAPERFDLDRARSAQAIDADAVAGAVRASLDLGGVTEADELDDLGELLVRSGRNLDARAFLGLATQIAPNQPGVHRALAEALFATGKPDDRALGERALGRARDLQPGEARLRAELALRAKGTPRTPQRDERWLVGPEALLARAKAEPAKKGEVADRQVYWLRAVTQHDDRRVSQMIQYGREIVIAPRTQEELYENIPAEGDETEILRARVHRASGEIAYAEEAKSDQGRPLIRWPDLRPGDVVEVAVRSWTSGPIGRRGDPPFYFLDYGGSISTHPLLYNEVILDLPKERPLAVDTINGKPDRVLTSEDGGRTITRFIWDKPLVFADEPFAPKPTETFPTLMVSSFASWDDFRTWYRGAVEGFTEPDEQVRQLAAELTKGKRTRDEKLKAIFEFVADDIRYVNYVSGEWWLPNRPQQLLARRQGDCDDKAILLITLLKSVGIEATEVLIQTRLTAQPSLLLSKKVAVPLFDHGIAYLPAKNGQPAIWLDATSPQSRLGPVPSMDTRTFALFATEGPAEMVATPRGSPDDYGVEATWTLTLRPGGAVSLEADERHRGDQAFQLRTALREKDSRAQWVEQNLIAGWIPQVQVDKEVDFSGDGASGEARVRYKATSNALGRMEGPDMVVTLAPSNTLTSSLAPLPRRTLPVSLPPHLAPSRQTTVVRMIAPEGMKPGELPSGGDANGGDFGRAQLEISLDPADPRVVLLKRSVIFDLETIPVARYEAWRTWLSRVDSLLHRSVRFVPAHAP